MGVNRPRRRGVYAPLSSRYFFDAAIIRAGERAELLYVRSLAFCAESMSDGFISDSQLRVICSGLTVIRRRIESLSEQGLWKRDEERQGFVVRSWLAWNPSREEILAAQARDAERKRSTNPRAFRTESGRNPNGIRTESGTVPRGIHAPDTDTESDADTDTESSTRPPAGSGRVDASARPRTARGAARAPVKPWLAERDVAPPPDLTDVRRKLSDASKARRARDTRRANALEELRRVTDDPPGDPE
jgi:hypothetical protein